jgi:Mn-dependent DtxR family transcriptional regulator
MSLYESGQMYLETIYVLSKEKNFVRSIDVGEHMGYSKPSVSRAVSTLKKDGYITVGEDGGLQLTEKGLEVAQAMYERHTVLTKLLMGLGVEESIASEDACRMEHVLSEESFAAIKAHMEMYAK